MSGDSGYDFYSPFMSAAIITGGGSRIPLFTGISSSEQETLDLYTKGVDGTGGLTSIPWLSSLTIELNLSYLPKINAVLTPPFREGQQFLASSLVEWGVTKIQVQFGYTAGISGASPVLSPVYEALLLKPEIQIGPDIVISLYGHGVASYSATVQ